VPRSRLEPLFCAPAPVPEMAPAPDAELFLAPCLGRLRQGARAGAAREPSQTAPKTSRSNLVKKSNEL
jgi:hypothetical protein